MQTRSTIIGMIFALSLVLISILILPHEANAIPTKWEKIDVSMSELLNSGWRISGHSSSRTAFNNGTIDRFDEITYTFLLTKNNDYVFCNTVNPSQPKANLAACRKIN